MNWGWSLGVRFTDRSTEMVMMMMIKKKKRKMMKREREKKLVKISREKNVINKKWLRKRLWNVYSNETVKLKNRRLKIEHEQFWIVYVKYTLARRPSLCLVQCNISVFFQQRHLLLQTGAHFISWWIFSTAKFRIWLYTMIWWAILYDRSRTGVSNAVATGLHVTPWMA